MREELKHDRRADLQSSIRKTLDLIREYEDRRRLSDDPKEQRNCERQLADLRRLLQEYNAELAELEKSTRSTGTTWPANIPDERYYALPTREQVLQELLATLPDSQGAAVIVIDGLGGLGKTALAVELARRALAQGMFAGLVGDSAKQETLAGDQTVQVKEASLDFDNLLNAIARQLERWEIPTLNKEEKVAALTRLLREKRYLVMVDNLETAENANALVTQLQHLLNGSRAIVTSRQKVQHNFVRSVSLGGLEAEDSFIFLRTDATQRGVQQILAAADEQLIEVHRATGGAPLALKLVVAQAGFLNLDLIIKRLQQASSNLYPYIFRESWQQLSGAAQRVLIYIGRTAVTHVSWEELAHVGITDNEENLIEAVGQLVAYSLLDVISTGGQMRYGIHQLTRQFVNSDLPQMWQQQGLL